MIKTQLPSNLSIMCSGRYCTCEHQEGLSWHNIRIGHCRYNTPKNRARTLATFDERTQVLHSGKISCSRWMWPYSDYSDLICIPLMYFRAPIVLKCNQWWGHVSPFYGFQRWHCPEGIHQLDAMPQTLQGPVRMPSFVEGLWTKLGSSGRDQAQTEIIERYSSTFHAISATSFISF